ARVARPLNPQRVRSTHKLYRREYQASGGLRRTVRSSDDGAPPVLDQTPQCAKWRVPVRYIGTPAAAAASTTRLSRTDPPGCTTARTPASSRTSSPSGTGKNAPEAATDPRARSPARATARRAESTRFTWPIPIPTAAPPEASRIALDFTARQARQAKARSASTSSG